MGFVEYIRSRSYQERLSIIFRVIRKQKGFSVSEMALFLGVDKARYQQWEMGTGMPDFLEWAQFCTRFDLDWDCCRVGTIDRGQPIVLRQSYPQTGFNLPARYLSLQATSNRWFIPIVEFLRYRMGELPFLAYCDRIGIDPDYFYICDQAVNFRMIHDIVSELLKQKKPFEGIQSIIHVAFEDLRSVQLQKIFDRHNSHEAVFLGLHNFNRYFDVAYTYELVEALEDGFYCCASAADWLKSDIVMDSEVKKWYHKYKAEWFRNLVTVTCQTQATIEMIELDDKRDPDCLFRIQIA